jgi:hypothetical protein
MREALLFTAAKSGEVYCRRWPDLIEAALAHVIGNQAERAYRRTDALAKRRVLMEDWAKYLDGNVGKVANFRPRSAPD